MELESFISRTDLRGDLDLVDAEKYNVDKLCIQYGIFISSVRLPSSSYSPSKKVRWLLQFTAELTTDSCLPLDIWLPIFEVH